MHRIHVRYELTDEAAEDVVAQPIRDGNAQLLSFMDIADPSSSWRSVIHTPSTSDVLKERVDPIYKYVSKESILSNHY